MDSKNILPTKQINETILVEREESCPEQRATVRVKEISERDRRQLLMHFLALNRVDRLLRFGNVLSDEAVTRYVQHINFGRDTLLGVYDANLQLVGVGHLVFTPRAMKAIAVGATDKQRVAEFGVSVSESARERGIGSKLLERATMHCRNADVDTVYVHCLASNQTMMHIAKKAGIQIQRDHAQADAYLKLVPTTSASVMREAVEEQVATLDYALKANARAARKLVGTISRHKG